MLKFHNIDRAVELREKLFRVDLALNGVDYGNLNCCGHFEGCAYDVNAIAGLEKVRAAVRPVLAYARSQIVGELNTLGIDAPPFVAAHGGKEG